jgi:hypothetical protein
MNKPKTLAYFCLHYGAEYLEASIKAIAPVVDSILILYTEKPSFGHGMSEVCPESKMQLTDILMDLSEENLEIGDKLIWLDIGAGNEGEHRNLAFAYCNSSPIKYDLLLAVDADEVWDNEVLEKCLNEAYKRKEWRFNIAGFVNFWKDFNHVVIDWFEPARIYNLNNHNTEQATLTGKVYHFGYAQSDLIMNYKFKIHGHADSLRENWLQEIYYGWTPEKRFLHPASLQIWEKAEYFDKNTLPEILHQHPNFNK